jgi:hypothetical protein
MPSTLLPICNKIIIALVSIFILVNYILHNYLLYLDGGNSEIVIAKFNYNAQESHELSIVKNERLLLLDDSCLWWKVKRVDSDDTG